MSEEVRGEAARLVRRLEVARERLVAVPGFDDDETCDLLTPAADRVARLHELARALANGALSEESAEEAVRALTATQPVRRPR